MNGPNVTVIAGGLSPDREGSPRPGSREADALRQSGVEVELRDVGKDMLPALAQNSPGCSSPCCTASSGRTQP
ncbi:hypothetical protein [Streptomyces phaeofaciens]|nr:hypothetical protein [Streptomyces phaeofaciens]